MGPLTCSRRAMGGDGIFVAGMVTMSTLLGMVGIPLWLAVLAMLR